MARQWNTKVFQNREESVLQQKRYRTASIQQVSHSRKNRLSADFEYSCKKQKFIGSAVENALNTYQKQMGVEIKQTHFK